MSCFPYDVMVNSDKLCSEKLARSRRPELHKFIIPAADPSIVMFRAMASCSDSQHANSEVTVLQDVYDHRSPIIYSHAMLL